MATPPIPQRAIDASRRLVGPARVLRALARLLALVGAVAAVALGLALAVGGVRVVVAVVLAVVLALPAWWLRHASETFGDLLRLPQQLQGLKEGTAPVTVRPRDLAPARLRRGGLVGAARTVRTTVEEVADAIGPVSSVVEVVAPTFWVWTAIAAGVAVVEAMVAPLAVLVALVT